jgi:hypothetical protein
MQSEICRAAEKNCQKLDECIENEDKRKMGIMVNQTHVFALCGIYAASAMEEPARPQRRNFEDIPVPSGQFCGHM